MCWFGILLLDTGTASSINRTTEMSPAIKKISSAAQLSHLSWGSSAGLPYSDRTSGLKAKLHSLSMSAILKTFRGR